MTPVVHPDGTVAWPITDCFVSPDSPYHSSRAGLGEASAPHSRVESAVTIALFAGVFCLVGRGVAKAIFPGERHHTTDRLLAQGAVTAAGTALSVYLFTSETPTP